MTMPQLLESSVLGGSVVNCSMSTHNLFILFNLFFYFFIDCHEKNVVHGTNTANIDLS